MKCLFTVRGTSSQPPILFLTDDCDPSRMSVTNDAEAVVAWCHIHYPGYGVVYRDSDGRWDEMVHDSGTFVGFKSYAGSTP